jgi:hypothetical protein
MGLKQGLLTGHPKLVRLDGGVGEPVDPAFSLGTNRPSQQIDL